MSRTPDAVLRKRREAVLNLYEAGLPRSGIAERLRISSATVSRDLISCGVRAREEGSARAVDELGRVRCRKCGEFKPPDMMRRGRSEASPCATICRRCHNKAHSGPWTPSSDYRLHVRARERAMSILAIRYSSEFEALVAELLAELEQEELIGWQMVAAHKRRIFGKPVTSENAPELAATG